MFRIVSTTHNVENSWPVQGRQQAELQYHSNCGGFATAEFQYHTVFTVVSTAAVPPNSSTTVFAVVSVTSYAYA